MKKLIVLIFIVISTTLSAQFDLIPRENSLEVNNDIVYFEGKSANEIYADLSYFIHTTTAYPKLAIKADIENKLLRWSDVIEFDFTSVGNRNYLVFFEVQLEVRDGRARLSIPYIESDGGHYQYCLRKNGEVRKICTGWMDAALNEIEYYLENLTEQLLTGNEDDW